MRKRILEDSFSLGSFFIAYESILSYTMGDARERSPLPFKEGLRMHFAKTKGTY